MPGLLHIQVSATHLCELVWGKGLERDCVVEVRDEPDSLFVSGWRRRRSAYIHVALRPAHVTSSPLPPCRSQSA